MLHMICYFYVNTRYCPSRFPCKCAVFLTSSHFSKALTGNRNNRSVFVLNPVLPFFLFIFSHLLPGRQTVYRGKSSRLPFPLCASTGGVFFRSFSFLSLFFPFSIHPVISGNYRLHPCRCKFRPAHLLSPFYKGSIHISRKITSGFYSIFPFAFLS